MEGRAGRGADVCFGDLRADLSGMPALSLEDVDVLAFKLAPPVGEVGSPPILLELKRLGVRDGESVAADAALRVDTLGEVAGSLPKDVAGVAWNKSGAWVTLGGALTTSNLSVEKTGMGLLRILFSSFSTSSSFLSLSDNLANSALGSSDLVNPSIL